MNAKRHLDQKTNKEGAVGLSVGKAISHGLVLSEVVLGGFMVEQGVRLHGEPWAASFRSGLLGFYLILAAVMFLGAVSLYRRWRFWKVLQAIIALGIGAVLVSYAVLVRAQL